MSTEAPLAVIARELSPGDRIKVGATTFVITALPEFTDEEHLVLRLVNPTTRQPAGFGSHWRHRFEIVPPCQDGDILPG